MQCYLMKGGHIVSIEELPTDLSDEEAVNQSWLVFEGRLKFWDDLDDFEVRHGRLSANVEAIARRASRVSTQS